MSAAGKRKLDAAALSPVGGYAMRPYAPPAVRSAIDLHLDANEGPGLDLDIGAILASTDAEGVRRYPGAAALEREIAAAIGVEASRVLVTAGGDDAIDRACRAFLCPGRALVLPKPTFEMIERYAQLAGAEVVTVPWPGGPFPVGLVLDAIGEGTGMIAVVSPNNPTGAVASVRDLEMVSRAAPGALVLVDLAYTEFADEDLTRAALALPNALVVRTFSKAYGLAGLRVGFAAGSESVIGVLRAAGAPFPVSGPSLAVAEEALRTGPGRIATAVQRVREERCSLAALLRNLGAKPRDSQANFVLAEFADSDWVWKSLAALGIAVRRFAGAEGLERALRITCPGRRDQFDRLCRGLRSALRPEGLLFDLDGVIADVSASYLRAISMTAAGFGVGVSAAEIAAAKSEGDANNDWTLTHRLIVRAGVAATLEDVTAKFEALYQGEDGRNGLESAETLLAEAGLFERLSKRVLLGIVTGRPRRDCERFLERFGIRRCFDAVVCMEDAPLKPSPAPVTLAMERMGIGSAWMVGDTPDDLVAARRAGVVPIGFAGPGDSSDALRETLDGAGAARVLARLDVIEEMLS